MDTFCNKVMRLLLIEQFSNTTIQNVYERWMFTEPLSFQSKVFSVLMQVGVIQNADSEYLAVKYYAPIYFFAQRWLFSGALSEERKSAFHKNAYQHIQRFFTEIGVAYWQILLLQVQIKESATTLQSKPLKTETRLQY